MCYGFITVIHPCGSSRKMIDFVLKDPGFPPRSQPRLSSPYNLRLVLLELLVGTIVVI